MKSMNGTAEFELVYVFIYLILRRVDIYVQACLKITVRRYRPDDTFSKWHLKAERERSSIRGGGHYFLNRTTTEPFE